MDILKKLLLLSFRKRNIILIKSFLGRKYKIYLDDLSLIMFMNFYYNEFSALLNYEMNVSMNKYKIFLYRLLLSKQSKILDILFVQIFTYLLFISKLLSLETQVNKLYLGIKNNKNYENYLFDISNKINSIAIDKIKYSKFVECNYQVMFTMIIL